MAMSSIDSDMLQKRIHEKKFQMNMCFELSWEQTSYQHHKPQDTEELVPPILQLQQLEPKTSRDLTALQPITNTNWKVKRYQSE